MADTRSINFLLKRLIYGFIVIFVAVMGYYVAANLLNFSASKILLNFKRNFIFFSALSSSISLLPYMLGASVPVIYAWLYPLALFRKKLTSALESDYVTTFFVFLAIVIILLFAVQDIAKPLIDAKISELKLISELSSEYLAKAKLYEGNHDYLMAIEYYKRYLSFEPKNTEVMDKLTDLERLKYQQIPKPQVTPENLPPQTDVAGLYNKAFYYAKLKEYVLAMYYLERYLTIAPNDATARGLYERVKQEYQAQTGTINKTAVELMAKKSEGLRLINTGRYVDAYLLFRDLVGKYPQDPSLRDYFAEATVYYKKVDFFIIDAEEKKSYPGLNSVLMKLTDAQSGGGKEQLKKTEYLVWVEKIVNYFNVLYLYNIHTLNLQTGAMTYYAYGKKVESYFVMKNVEFQPTILNFEIDPSMLKKFVLFEQIDKYPLADIVNLRKFIDDIGYGPWLFNEFIVKKVSYYLIIILYLVVLFRLSMLGWYTGTAKHPEAGEIIVFLICGAILVVAGYQFIAYLQLNLIELFTLSMAPAFALVLMGFIDIALCALLFFL